MRTSITPDLSETLNMPLLTSELAHAFTNAYEPYEYENLRQFLPLGRMNEIMKPKSIVSHLREIWPDGIPTSAVIPSLRDEGDHHEAIGRYICGQQIPATVFASKPDTAMKLFSILVHIEQESAILAFMKEGITDKNLPFQKHQMEGADFHLALSCGKEITSFIPNWNRLAERSFDTCQWQVLSPILQPGDNKKFERYKFGSQTILPFSHAEATPDTNCRVWKVIIDEHHHNFAEPNNAFALKQLQPTHKDWFEWEMDAFERIPLHDHLTPLYATIEHKGHFHLLLPWALGKSLYSMWQQEAPRNSREYWMWFVKQCLGIASGLDCIHDTNLGMSDGVAAQLPYPEDDRTCGRHGDIKPNNILWFHDHTEDKRNHGGKHGEYGRLKICDFGLTRFSKPDATKATAKNIRVTQTYRPPEYDINEKVSRPFDIWSLGCVYVEFITWLLLGGQGISEFDKLRQRESVRPHIRGDHFFDIVNGERHKEPMAVLGTENRGPGTSDDVKKGPDTSRSTWSRLRSKFRHSFLSKSKTTGLNAHDEIPIVKTSVLSVCMPLPYSILRTLTHLCAVDGQITASPQLLPISRRVY
ncbi:kinase-like domain-containing protein [Stachybotrys elegans]|uniref:Kinase-like domain-containing protein n=1 Tax=Stachybotrys elegans TaxID=80388 RepID=A0A8K0WLS4_9HYPO|nr:kinase-like domain-containing protein [Stachybotrys elegans]